MTYTFKKKTEWSGNIFDMVEGHVEENVESDEQSRSDSDDATILYGTSRSESSSRAATPAPRPEVEVYSDYESPTEQGKKVM